MNDMNEHDSTNRMKKMKNYVNKCNRMRNNEKKIMIEPDYLNFFNSDLYYGEKVKRKKKTTQKNILVKACA